MITTPQWIFGMRVRILGAGLLISAIISGCGQWAANSDVRISQSNFVRVAGNHFVLSGKPYYFAGTNMWYGAYLGAPGEVGDRARLTRELDLLKANGITNLRVLAISEQSELSRSVDPAFLTTPGNYNEVLLQGLDFLLAEMAKRNMKAVLYLTNFWQWSGGMSQYVAWIDGTPVLDPDVTGRWNEFMNNSARFYQLGKAQSVYRDAIKAVITRRNTITGLHYNEDPTVMSWQLANEPRPGNGEEGRKHFKAFENWIDQTAQYIDSLAPYQLISTGNEGSRGTLDDMALYIQAHDSPYIDYLTFHMWLKNWQWFDIKKPEQTLDAAMAKAVNYIDAHIEVAEQLGKPIVLSEFGVERDMGAFEPSVPTQYRDRIYREIYDLLYQRAAEGSPLAGSNFWSWGGFGRTTRSDYMWQEGDDYTGDPPQEAQGLNSVFDVDASTLGVIREHAEKMGKLVPTGYPKAKQGG